MTKTLALPVRIHVQRKTTFRFGTHVPSTMLENFQTLSNLLLSIFPLQGMFDYVRLSCIELDDTAGACSPPFTVSKPELVHLLAVVFPVEQARHILGEIESGHTVQIPITIEQSRDLGFQPKLN